MGYALSYEYGDTQAAVTLIHHVRSQTFQFIGCTCSGLRVLYLVKADFRREGDDDETFLPFHFAVVPRDRWTTAMVPAAEWLALPENQATDRAYRIGQYRNVQVHKFVTVGTLEEMIDEMIERKKGLAEAVIGTGEGWLTELSTEALHDLVRFRATA